VNTANLDFEWADGSPASGVPADHFSDRWLRYVNLESGFYRFTIFTDDGVRFWIDDRLVLESWQHQRETYEVTVYLEAGYHRLLVEHWEDYGWAALSLNINISMCPIIPIQIGEIVSGTLTSTDCRSSVRSNAYADLYSFSASAGQRIVISLDSYDFDTYLYLKDPDGSVIAEDDDGGYGTNSRIPSESGYYSLPADGDYLIEVTSWSSQVTGSYTLRLIEPSLAYLPLTLRDYVAYFEGPWEQEPNNSYLQANGPLRSGRDYYGYPDEKDYFSIYLRSGGTITIDLTNHTGQGVQLQLFYQSTNNRVDSDLNAPYHITYTGPAGWYYIYIYTAGGYNTTTPYTLRVTYP
jgi:hypothetical protein